MIHSDKKLFDFLASEELETKIVPEGTTYWRIHHKDCVIDNRVFADSKTLPHDIIHWSPGGRFGLPDNKVLYLGETEQGAFLEAMCSDPSGGIEISRSRLEQYACSSIDTPKALELVDFTSINLLKNRVDAQVFSRTDDDGRRRHYSFARLVSQAVKQNPRAYNGICFQSRVNPDNRNIAIFFKNETLWRAMQGSIVLAERTLFYEAWVYQMQVDGIVTLTIID